MSYSTSLGQVAGGGQATCYINTGSVGTPVWLAVEECKTVEPSGVQLKTVDATNLQSTVVEVLPTLVDPGTVKVSAIRIPPVSGTGQLAVLTQFNLGNAQVPVEFKIALNTDTRAGQTSTGDYMIASCYITECPLMSDLSPEKIVMFDFTLKAVTAWTLTVGS